MLRRLIKGTYLYYRTYRTYQQIRREAAARAASIAVWLAHGGALRKQA